MQTDERLRAIEARARALGWGIIKAKNTFELRQPIKNFATGFHYANYGFGYFDEGYTAAESLLALHEAKGTVEIGKTCNGCPMEQSDAISGWCSFDWEDWNKYIPGPLCPGPGTYALVPVAKEEE